MSQVNNLKALINSDDEASVLRTVYLDQETDAVLRRIRNTKGYSMNELIRIAVADRFAPGSVLSAADLPPRSALA